MLKKVVESILLGGSSGVPHLLPKKNQVRHFYMIISTDLEIVSRCLQDVALQGLQFSPAGRVVVCICHEHVLIMNHFCLNYVFYCC